MSRKDSVEWHVRAAIDKVGAYVMEITRNRHVKIKWAYKGQTRLITVPSSASDHRAVKNAVAQIKRDAREIDGV